MHHTFEWTHKFQAGDKEVKVVYDPATDEVVSARYVGGRALTEDERLDLEQSLQDNVCLAGGWADFAIHAEAEPVVPAPAPAAPARYAAVSWTVDDVHCKAKELGRALTDEQAEAFLRDNQNQIADDMVLRGWDSIETLLGDMAYERDTADGQEAEEEGGAGPGPAPGPGGDSAG